MMDGITVIRTSDLKQLLIDGINEAVDKKLSFIANTDKEQLLTIQATADFFQVTKVTIGNWRKRGIIKGIPFGGRIYFRKSDLFEAISKNNLKPNPSKP